MNIREYNRTAWDRSVERGNEWTLPVDPETIELAREGRWAIILTPMLPVPRTWFPHDLHGVDILCLASGGGQQGPILAAVGGAVTVFDNSPKQLAQDRLVAEREGLTIATVEGDMADLSAFADESFDLIVHPCSNVFAVDIAPVWREAYRVLRPGGSILSGITNPVSFIFDDDLAEQGTLSVRHKLPYSDMKSLTEEERRRYTDKGEPLIFAHSLDDQIGGQIEAGFLIAGFYEDYARRGVVAEYFPSYMATRAIKPIPAGKASE